MSDKAQEGRLRAANLDVSITKNEISFLQKEIAKLRHSLKIYKENLKRIKKS